ncbi:MAG: MaoC family dehydratase N-terminal domain-containing protein [Alphaproteobacteria bacterium]|nr:MaoC family dehydratase N-terminal domain-containing protein [Alphaproteobacteria bacterium]
MASFPDGDLGEYTFTESEMIAFARQYDPQTFHTDPRAAEASIHGGLIASGWMTVAVMMKLITARAADTTPGAVISPGFENLRWHKAVRPGTTLRYTSRVTERRALKSRPTLELVLSRAEARDRDGTLYMSIVTKVLMEKGSAA